MGRLMVAVSRLYVDTNIFIRLFEHNDELSRALTALFTAQRSGRPFLATSELTLAELLVTPFKEGNDVLIEDYDAWMISNSQLEVSPVVRPVLWYAAILRSQYAALRTPDAIHVSPAMRTQCSHFLTADKRLTNRYELAPHRYGMVKGPLAVEVVRPAHDVVQQLTEVAAR
jgi:predicted nucleic acid-binding protein